MRLGALAWLVAVVVAVVPGCVEDDCQNPKRTTYHGQEGPAVKCHVAVLCPGHAGTRDKLIRLKDEEDPIIVDRGSASRNKAGCEGAMKDKNICVGGTIQAEPALICLDATGMPDGSSPDVTSTSGGTLVTVGVGAGTGDYYLNGSDEGAGGFGGAFGEGGGSGN